MTYVPENMPQPTREEAARIARRLGFGTVVSMVGARYHTSHVPIHVDIGDNGEVRSLGFHLANRNEMTHALKDAAPAPSIVIMRGPDGYISPSWYDHENVPTWDYVAVHFEGSIEPLPTHQLKDHLRELLEIFDPALCVRVGYIDEYLSWITGFRVDNPTVKPVFKLSQDKNEASVEGVLTGLGQRGETLDGDLASAIRARYAEIGRGGD